MTSIRRTALMAVSAFALSAAAAQAATVDVTITNNSVGNGLFFTPFLSVFHDGSYDPFNGGVAASPGLEELAEVGSTATAAAEADAALDDSAIITTLTEPAGVGPAVGGPPVFDPGNSATLRVDINDTDHSQLTLLSMAIPSNDTFVSITIDLFTGGVVNFGTSIIDLTNVYDAGTEVNQTFGQAFNPADGDGPGFLGDDENGVVHLPTLVEFATLFGQPTPVGVSSLADTNLENLVSIEIAPVPLPAAAPLLIAGLGGMAFVARRKKKQR